MYIRSVHLGPQRSANGCYSQTRWILISSWLQQAWDVARFYSACLACVKPWLWTSAPYKSRHSGTLCHPCTQWKGGGRSEIWSHPNLCGQFECSWHYVGPWLKKGFHFCFTTILQNIKLLPGSCLDLVSSSIEWGHWPSALIPCTDSRWSLIGKTRSQILLPPMSAHWFLLFLKMKNFKLDDCS